MSSTDTKTHSPEAVKRASVVDLRSDTVTKPSPEMRRAMMEAEVGDDVYGEDPTINRLEHRAAEIFGREAAILVPTGTMGNQIAIKIHTRPGQEIICEERAHIKDYEMAMLAQFSGCLPRTVAGEKGIPTWKQIQRKIQPPTYYIAQTGLIALENTHNMAGGTVIPIETINDICDGAHSVKLPVHMDGARVFNASAALGKPVSEITKNVDSVMFCLSKGLGAPVGSLLVGSKEFIRMARIYRKSLGGGMRQAGILAAAGLIALEQGPKRLHDDHGNAKHVAERLADIRGINIDAATVQTNIVIFDVSGTGMDTADFARKLAEKNVLASGISPELMRIVTHLDVDRAACDHAVNMIEEICA
ncbi:L-threonine aldolase [Candidatus Koribacter versatilis Ellin345]|uniref:L-threonine aldolase n=1 Tax=Koribacter versatilis (strain Ellin345) TaxID=204669 RepID=Q1IP32_KORVE|nr:GntG family PLP-dependent aldolase [Candidatus Koribacter versatilis]ABF41368.1 L-threonine aldolase [Candidatus Koribacter versatilis Ellin345]